LPDQAAATVEIERCVTGRLRQTYPVSAHDIEARVLDPLASPVLTDLLRTLAAAIEIVDPQCRRIVYAARTEQPEMVAAAEAAGFRYVLDVDLADAELSLLVAEPAWVTAVVTARCS
jgi:hypothetical protein